MHRYYFCDDCNNKEKDCKSTCSNYKLVPTTIKPEKPKRSGRDLVAIIKEHYERLYGE